MVITFELRNIATVTHFCVQFNLLIIIDFIKILLIHLLF